MLLCRLDPAEGDHFQIHLFQLVYSGGFETDAAIDSFKPFTSYFTESCIMSQMQQIFGRAKKI